MKTRRCQHRRTARRYAHSGQGANLAIALATQDVTPTGVVSAAKHYAVSTDHQGSPRQIINHTRQTLWQWPLSAFGEIPPNTAAQGFNAPDTQPVQTTAQTLTHNIRYAGQYFDQETNLFDNWHRTYNPQTGRYTQNDPIGLEGGWNRYGYVGGNALSFNDPTGENYIVGGILLAGGLAYGYYKFFNKADDANDACQIARKIKEDNFNWALSGAKGSPPHSIEEEQLAINKCLRLCGEVGEKGVNVIMSPVRTYGSTINILNKK